MPIPLTVLILAALPQQPVGGRFEIVDERFDPHDEIGFGRAVLAPGDLDGDGDHELLVSSTSYSVNEGGSVYLYSGGSALPVREWREPSYEFRSFGASLLAPGDLDGDGIEDFVVAGPWTWSPWSFQDGLVRAYSSATGEVIWNAWGSFPVDQIGTSLAVLDDWNQDGVPEILAGAPQGMEDRAYVISGKSGDAIAHVADRWTESYGEVVAAPVDVNGDGLRDVFVADPWASSTGVPRHGAVWIYSAMDLKQLAVLKGDGKSELLGYSMRSLGDLDGDGITEWCLNSGGRQSGNTLGPPGKIRVYSGPRLTPIWIWQEEVLSRPLVAPWYDCDADGVTDLVVSCQGADDLLVISGADGSRLGRIEEPSSGFAFIEDFMAAPPTHPDAFPSLYVGSPGSSPPAGNSGSGAVYRVLPDPFLQLDRDSISASTGGTVQLDLDFPDEEAGRRYVLLASAAGAGFTNFRGLTIPLLRDRLYRSMITGPPGVFRDARGALDGDGRAVAGLVLPPGAAAPYVGSTIRFVAVTLGGVHARVSSMPRLLTIRP